VIGGGFGNTIQSFNSFIGGGYSNTVRGGLSVIGGGDNNFIDLPADHSTIVGGSLNRIFGSDTLPVYDSIGGGYFNIIQTDAVFSTIASGMANSINAGASNSTISGGSGNISGGNSATVPGGFGNVAFGNYSFAAGRQAHAVHPGAFVWADSQNASFSSTANDEFKVRAQGGARFLTGGAGVTVDGRPVITSQPLPDDPSHSNIVNNVSGSPGNFVTSGVYGATISGGGAGYYLGVASVPNSVAADFGTVGGGAFNTVSGVGDTIAGGGANISSGEYSVVGGGQANVSEGSGSTVPGGSQNSASGRSSFAAGSQASAIHDGTFVWAGGAKAPFPSTQANTFNAYAASGASFDYGGQRRDGRGDRWFYVGNLNAGSTVSVWNGARLTDGGIWANASDKNRKTDFEETDSREILERLAALPVRGWRYTNEDSGVKHLGPVAQDFRAAFGLGTDDKTIGTVDADGVALAAIQGLNQKLNGELKRRDIECADLKRELDELNGVVESLARQLGVGTRPAPAH